MSLNTLILTGNLGSDPRFALTPTGKQKASFSIASSRSYRGQKHTEWTTIVLWGTLAARAEKLLAKGQAVMVHGEKRTRTYTDTHGVERQVVELVASDFQREPSDLKAASLCGRPPSSRLAAMTEMRRNGWPTPH